MMTEDDFPAMSERLAKCREEHPELNEDEARELIREQDEVLDKIAILTLIELALLDRNQ